MIGFDNIFCVYVNMSACVYVYTMSGLSDESIFVLILKRSQFYENFFFSSCAAIIIINVRGRYLNLNSSLFLFFLSQQKSTTFIKYIYMLCRMYRSTGNEI